MQKIYCLIILFLIPSKIWAARAIMEGISASNDTIFIDTTNVRVGIGTTNPTETLHIVGNSTTSGNAYVTGNIYSSGIYYGDGSGLTGTGDVHLASTQTFTGQNTFSNWVTVSSNVVVFSSVTASAFFGDGSHLTGISAGGAFQLDENDDLMPVEGVFEDTYYMLDENEDLMPKAS